MNNLIAAIVSPEIVAKSHAFETAMALIVMACVVVLAYVGLFAGLRGVTEAETKDRPKS